MRISSAVRCAAKCATKPRTFSGIQPTGALHLGNYLGAVQQWVNDLGCSADERDSRIFSIVDLHAITLPQDPKALNSNITEMAASLIGCGLDTEKCVLFQQSKVPQHTELCWLLGCFSSISHLKNLTQYKEKSANMTEVPLGLFLYPLLQAADILAYKATNVPVGADNLQNVELARAVARIFNHKLKSQVFPIPEAVLVDKNVGQRVKSLRHPANKMSKSDPDQKGCLYVTDTADVVIKKIKKAVTDATSHLSFDPENRPGVSNLISIHSQIVGRNPDEVVAEFSGVDTGQYKVLLADIIVEHFTPLRQRIEYLLDNKDHLSSVLDDGAARASVIAEETLHEVRNLIGITR